jgi:hypothetical protein
MNLINPDTELADFCTETKLSIEFETPAILPIEINHHMNTPGQKTSQILSKTPMADMMLHPEKADAVLKALPAKKTAMATRKSKTTAKTAEKSAGTSDLSDPRGTPRKKAKFIFKAAQARSVKLAGDFTDWEKFPVEMKPSEDGAWATVLTLEPGEYAYRFIVDGEWRDDPHCTKRVTNPFGTQNAVVEIR